MLRRNWANETSKKWRIVFVTTEESCDRESIVDSDSGITASRKFHVRCKRILWSWIREQLWSDPRSLSNFYDSEFHDFAALRFWIAAKHTELYGYHGKRFWTTICSRRTIFYNLQQFKEFHIFISGCETWYFRDSKERCEKGIVEYADSIISFPKWKWNFGSHWWNLFSRWYNGSSQSSFSRHGILENFVILWNFRVGSLISGLKFCLRTAEPHSSHYAMDQRSSSSEIDWRTFYIATDCRTR